MSAAQGEAKAVETPSGRISYLEAGSGPRSLSRSSLTAIRRSLPTRTCP